RHRVIMVVERKVLGVHLGLFQHPHETFVEKNDAAARLQHTAQLAEGLSKVRTVMHGRGREHDVERTVTERQMVHVGVKSFEKEPLFQIKVGDLEVIADVDRHELGTALRDLARGPTESGADLEDACAGLEAPTVHEPEETVRAFGEILEASAFAEIITAVTG